MKSVLKYLPMLAILLSAMGGFSQKVENISPIKAKLMARNGSVMIDVREKDEVAKLAYDVNGIKNIPLSEFANRLNEIPKDKPIILACRSGNRSAKAAQILIDNGYTQVYNMEGGMLAWKEKNLEVVESGKSSKKACCSEGKSKGCKPDGSCKSKAKE